MSNRKQREIDACMGAACARQNHEACRLVLDSRGADRGETRTVFMCSCGCHWSNAVLCELFDERATWAVIDAQDRAERESAARCGRVRGGVAP